MKYDSLKHHRRSIRLRGYDYTQVGAYFVTIVARDRECIFGDIVDGEVRLNDIGRIVQEEWLQTPHMRPEVQLDAFVVMPNHLHGIIVIVDDPSEVRARRRRAPATTEQFGKPVAGSIPTIVRAFKSITTKRVNLMRDTQGASVWHRNYHEHIIREERELNTIRQYITNNPANWSADEDNPKKVDRM